MCVAQRGCVGNVSVDQWFSRAALLPSKCLFARVWGGAQWLSGHPECHVYLFDKLCGLSVLCVFANLFFKKKKGRKGSNKHGMLNVYHFTWICGQPKCNYVPGRTKVYFPGERFSFRWLGLFFFFKVITINYENEYMTLSIHFFFQQTKQYHFQKED